jgi:hypothetical protein
MSGPEGDPYERPAQGLLIGVLLVTAMLGIIGGIMLFLEGGYSTQPSRYSSRTIYIGLEEGGWIMAVIFLALGAVALLSAIVQIRHRAR